MVCWPPGAEARKGIWELKQEPGDGWRQMKITRQTAKNGRGRVVGRTAASQDSHVPTSGTCERVGLHGKGDRVVNRNEGDDELTSERGDHPVEPAHGH